MGAQSPLGSIPVMSPSIGAFSGSHSKWQWLQVAVSAKGSSHGPHRQRALPRHLVQASMPLGSKEQWLPLCREGKLRHREVK